MACEGFTETSNTVLETNCNLHGKYPAIICYTQSYWGWKMYFFDQQSLNISRNFHNTIILPLAMISVMIK